MASYNDITGDKIQSRVNNKQFEDNFDKIFIQKTKVEPTIPTSDQPVDTTDDWDEKRVDIIGSNGPTGDHYKEQK
jgi:hypothetical protein